MAKACHSDFMKPTQPHECLPGWLQVQCAGGAAAGDGGQPGRPGPAGGGHRRQRRGTWLISVVFVYPALIDK